MRVWRDLFRVITALPARRNRKSSSHNAEMLSQLRTAWALTKDLSKSIQLAKEQTQRDSTAKLLDAAAMEAEKLKTLIEEIAKEVKE